MSDVDNSNPTPVPMKQNINIVSILGALFVVLVDFGLPLTLKQQTDLLVLAGLVIPAAVIFFHTFINHPKNQVAAKTAISNVVSKAEGTARKTAPALLACIIACSIFLGGCATANSIPTTLTLVEQAFTTAQVLYNSVCANNQSLSFCSKADMDAANAAADAVRSAIDTANTVLAKGSSTTQQVAAAVKAVQDADAAFEKIVNLMQAKKAAMLAAAAH
ncbi:hypothetical protein [uncultured Devosia sp.]|uniref:hypothetical protein n=1 Tax=uncultured Devosia sp. TaxID=211434 RepID=UPI0026040F1F|nr:hypothetical protein [uncultured Devosia sp.]